MKKRTICILKNLAITFIPALVIVVCMILWVTYSPAVIRFVVNPGGDPCGDHFGTCQEGYYPQPGVIPYSLYIVILLILVCGYMIYRWAIKPCLVKEEENKP